MTFSKIRETLDKDPNAFEQIALDVFRYQYAYNEVYQSYVLALGKNEEEVRQLKDIPFLPISFFKNKEVVTHCSPQVAEVVFTSSGTTGQQVSKHFVKDLEIYNSSMEAGFELYYGSPSDYVFLALLPAYLERKGSSLVYMVDAFMKKSKEALNGFFLDNVGQLVEQYQKAIAQNKKVIIIGVSFALLDLAEKGVDFSKATVIETGGMKGRRKEMIRDELHLVLSKGLNIKEVHSEYGMTELLSQAYSKGQGVFQSPPWMRFLYRDVNDPLSYVSSGKTGGINVVDLANIHSCSFIATQDLGRELPNGKFKVLGRFDHSDMRGCNLMVY